MLNLLPPEIKSRHKVRSSLFTVALVYIVLAAIFILGPIALATLNFVQGSQISGYQSEITQVKAQIGQSKDISNKLAFVESRTKQASQYTEPRDWREYLDVIADATPSSVVVTGIRLEDGSAKTPTFTVNGTGSVRRAVVLFNEKLQENEAISQSAFTSLSETANETGKTFTYSLTVTFKE